MGTGFMSRLRLPRLRTFDAWNAYRDYRYLWVANFCLNTSQWLQLLTLGWLVRDLTATDDFSSSAFKVITVGGLTNLPVLFVGPWSGVLGDRVDRRKLVISTQSFMLIAAVTFALVYEGGLVDKAWHVYIYALVSGVCRSITMPMQQALIANTVPREAVGSAYASNVLTIPGTRMVGPFVGGMLIHTMGFTWNFVLEAALYGAMILALIPMRMPYLQKGTAGQSSPLADLKEGIAYIWSGERVIFDLMVLALIPNLLLQPLMFLLPVFTADVFHKEADFGGYLMATTGFGGFLAAALLSSWGWPFRKGMVCLVAGLTSSIAAIAFAQTQWLIPAFVVVACFSLSQAYFRTTSGALIQILSPDHLRARVTALQNYGGGFVIFSALLIGVFAEQTSAPTAMTVVGVLGVGLAIVSLVSFRRLRRLEQ